MKAFLTRFFWIGIALGIALAVLSSWAAGAFGSTGRFVRIIGSFTDSTFKGRQYAIVPAVAPTIIVEQIAGVPLPSKGITACHWRQEQVKDSGLEYKQVVGHCEDGVKLVVTFIDLEN